LNLEDSLYLRDKKTGPSERTGVDAKKDLAHAAEAWGRGRPTEALELLEHIDSNDSQYIEAAQLGLKAAFSLGIWQQVCRWGEALAPDQRRDELGGMYGIGLMRVGRTNEAQTTLEEAAESGCVEAHYHLGLFYIRQGRKPRIQQQARGHLEAVLRAYDGGYTFPEVDRIFFALGQMYSRVDDNREAAIKLFRKGLSINPLSAIGHNSLGELLLSENQILGALGEFKVALQLDPQMPAAYTNLAHILYYHIRPEELEQEYAHLIEEFGDLGPRVISRLAQELVSLSREQVFRSLYTKGHQLKNLMGILGSRLRRLLRRSEQHKDMAGDLTGIVAEQDHLYQEWVGYLATMHAERLEPVAVDPAKVVRRVIEAVGNQEAGVEIALRLQKGVPMIEADERLLREALTNLCFNAIDAVRSTKGKVAVGLGCDDGAATVYIEIEDDGPGIEPGMLEHIFDPGFTTKAHGNGYGLSIARRIAHAHRGELRVKSQPRHGTVFRLDLPVNYEAFGEPDSLGGGFV
jgi:signal transduction histidine kinase